MALVLCTGSSRALLKTRIMILEQAGHTVIGTMSEPELMVACNEHQFDVAVIGQGLSAPQKNRVFQLVQEHCPRAKVLELYLSHRGKKLTDADDWLEVPGEFPQHLAERVSALANRDNQRQEKA